MVDLFARPRYVWAVAGFTCCGPGGEAYSDPLGSLKISGVFTERSAALIAFYKHLSSMSQYADGTPAIDSFARTVDECRCEEACLKVCKEQHEAAKPAEVERAQKALDEALLAQREAPSAQNEQAVQDRDEELKGAMEGEFSDNCEWSGPSFVELTAQFLAGEPGAERFFHIHNIEADADGGLRFFDDKPEGDIVTEVRMTRMKLE
jgi:hypothetical protein